mgnify:CR=1 FL=1
MKTLASLLELVFKNNETYTIIFFLFNASFALADELKIGYIDVDTVYVMKDGEVKATWDATLAKQISESGFSEI